MKTYGRYRHDPTFGRGTWYLDVQPHVAIMLKRIFPRVRQERTGSIIFTDTPEVANDLEWLMLRWPLEPADDHSRDRLAFRAEQYRNRQKTVQDVLAGLSRPDRGWREPAVPPRDYQLVAGDLALATGRLLLVDDLGLGKTFSGALVFRDPNALPGLVVCQAHLTLQWRRELARFFPWLKTHIIASRTPYDLVGDPTLDGIAGPDVIIASYTKVGWWADHLAGKVRSVVFDEIQELRHPDTKKWTACARIADKADYKVGLTATPVFNMGHELHTIVNLLDRDVLGSRHEFLREWCAYGSEGKVEDPAALGTYLRDQGVLLRRSRKDVGRELPEVIRVEQHVDTDVAKLENLAGDVTAMARLVLDNNVAPQERWHAAGELDMRMRHATGVAKAPYVAEFVRLLLETEERVVLWGWHRDVWDLWRERLHQFNPVMYTGSESPREKDEAARAFIEGRSRILMMSLRSGAGLDGLQNVCNVGVFGELDWSPAQHAQCIGRLHRDGQQEPVVVYFMVSDEGADPPMAEVLQLKRQQAEPILDPDGDLVQILSTDGTDRIRALAEQVLRRKGVEPPAASDLADQVREGPFIQEALV